jgi:hypothetical protein
MTVVLNNQPITTKDFLTNMTDIVLTVMLNIQNRYPF